MKISFQDVDTNNLSDVFLLSDIVEAMKGNRPSEKTFADRGIQRGTGPVAVPEPTDIQVWTSEGNEDLAAASLNVTDDIGEVTYNTIPKTKPDPKKPTAAEATKKHKADKKAEAKKAQEATKKAAAKKLADAAKAEGGPIVSVETPEAKVKDAPIEEALDALNPSQAEKDEAEDKAVALRTLMVAIVKAHGPKGAKIASQIVHQLSGVKDVTKIPEEKYQEVADALKAACEPAEDKPEEIPSEPEPSAGEEDSQPSDDDLDGMDF